MCCNWNLDSLQNIPDCFMQDFTHSRSGWSSKSCSGLWWNPNVLWCSDPEQQLLSWSAWPCKVSGSLMPSVHVPVNCYTGHMTGCGYTFLWFEKLLLTDDILHLGCFPFTSPRRQRRRQTRQRLFTLPKSPAGDVLSINGNSGNAGDTGFAG